jgi:hypothetical protein
MKEKRTLLSRGCCESRSTPRVCVGATKKKYTGALPFLLCASSRGRTKNFIVSVTNHFRCLLAGPFLNKWPRGECNGVIFAMCMYHASTDALSLVKCV